MSGSTTEAHKRYIQWILRSAVRKRAEYLHGRLLDVGCGEKPYERDLRKTVTEHVGVDHEATLHGLSKVDIVASAYDIPVDESSFDSVLATEVLEHLEDPIAALREWRRALKPGGCAVVTAPFIWHLHEEPRDFYRYSAHGMRHVIESAGLEVVEIEMLGGFWSTFGQLFAYVITSYRWARWLRLTAFLAGTSQRVGGWLERRSPRPAWGSHVVAVARKPEE
jgi:SAM-dependent methyltransferase